MIQSGGWSNLRAPDEHTKLARVAVSFLPKLDEAFKINVAKMRVQMPPQIRDAVRDAIGPVVKLAREVYDRKSAKPSHATPQTASRNIPDQSSKERRLVASSLPHCNEAVPTYSVDHKLLTLEQWSELVLAVSTQEERTVIERILHRLSKSSSN
jgi:hypothetical protein